MEYDKMQKLADDMQIMFQTKYKVDAGELDDYTKLVEEMTIVRQEPF